MELIDTHSHLFTEEFDEDRAQVVRRAQEAGVKHLYLPNIDRASLPALWRTVAEFPDYCTPMLGLHPTSVKESYQEDLSYLYTLLQQDASRFAAVGEIGMDLYWDQTFREAQLQAFETQILWAKEWSLPIAIHNRDAFSDTFQTVSRHADSALRGVFHSFGGSREEARQLLALPGFYLGINGVVTFKNSRLAEVLRAEVPLERIVLETDCPYLAPVPHRGKRNESAFLVLVAEKLAAVYGESLETIVRITTQNAEDLFQKKR